MNTKHRLITFSLSAVLLVALAAAFAIPKMLPNANASLQMRVSVQGHTGGSCGITKTGSGYTFEWLHTANGTIVTTSGCTIDLRGFNLPGTGFGRALGTTNAQRLSQDIPWYAQTFHMNFWRVFLNAYWWNNDVNVPDAGMHYRAWIQHVVTLLENNGNYVLLQKGPQFHELPCGGSVTYCPPQNQAEIDIHKDPHNVIYQHQLTTGQYIDDAVTMWNSVATLFAKNPAVLYGSWNEMHSITDQLWQQNTSTLVNTIQAHNSQALVFVGAAHYQNGISPIITGSVPPFSESNIVYDFHVYNGYNGSYQGQPCQEPANQLWVQWPQNATAQTSYVQQKQHAAVSFSEWGGCNDVEPYNTDITTFATSHHIALAYYALDTVVNLMKNGSYQLNSNGTKVQAAYAAMG
ncbi:MAG: hypothetical protein NVSMB49_06300 [Ktedonobacteraceae bacterium]